MDSDSVTTGDLVPLDSNPALDLRKLKKLHDVLLDVSKAESVPQEEFDKIVKDKASNPFGVDHNYCFGGTEAEPREIARVQGSTGRTLTVLSTAAGVQCYTANYIQKLTGKNAAQYHQWQAVCLETQSYPNSICVDGQKHPEFKKGETFILRPGQDSYWHRAVYRMGVNSGQ